MIKQNFERCTPEEVGIPSSAIMKFIDALEYGGYTEMHGLMIMRHDKVCCEGWWAPFAPQRHHTLHSLTKTYAATAVGICEYKGLLKLSDRVCDIIPEVMPNPISENAAKITVENILTMTSGSETEKENYSDDFIEDFFAHPIEHTPGTFWRYNSHNSAILSAVVEKVTGMKMLDFLDKELFCKIGIDSANIMCYRGGHDIAPGNNTAIHGIDLGGHGMFTTTEDNIRLMRVYMNDGVVKETGERVMSHEYVAKATTKQAENAPAHAKTPWIHENVNGYGYQIWLCRDNVSYRADGAFGQFCIVVPYLDMIISMNQAVFAGDSKTYHDVNLLEGKEGEYATLNGSQAVLDAVFEMLIPSVKTGDEPIEASPDSAILAERMKRLAVPSPSPRVVNIVKHNFNVTLKADGDNKISFSMLQCLPKHNHIVNGADTIRFEERGGILRVSFKESDIMRTFNCGMLGSYCTNTLFFGEYDELASDTAASAWWENDNVLHVDIRWYETVNVDHFTFTFDSGKVHVKEWITTGPGDALQTRTGEYVM